MGCTLKSIDIIAGARPNFMKISPIIRALNNRKSLGGALRYRLVHTGQHYNAFMSGDFFDQLEIPQPDVNLDVGSGSHAEQTASIMIRYENLLKNQSTDLCLVVGDVTSTMACAITAQKLHVPVAHVEAGIRSGDWTMPEEINRLVTDSISNYYFTTSEVANENLNREGVSASQIYFVGNTMIDSLLYNMHRLQPPSFWEDYGLAKGEYFVVTLHRPDNVDVLNNLKRILIAIGESTRGLPVIFPVHPRTLKSMNQLSDVPLNIRLVNPQPYLEFNYLVKHSKGVITDSGGITEETTVMNIPCLTLRNSTERPETVTAGTNILIGSDPVAIKPSLDLLFSGKWKKGSIPDFWDGRTGERIVSILERVL